LQIPDGLIPILKYVTYWLLILVPLYMYLRRDRQKTDGMKMSLLAVLAPGIFAIPAINLPITLETSEYIIGVVLAAIVLLLAFSLMFMKFAGKIHVVKPDNETDASNLEDDSNGNGNGWVSTERDWGTPYIIETRDLVHIYRSGSTTALDGINFCVKPGERIVLLGANGAGKSTLFKHLNGILKATSGQVFIKGQPVSRSISGTYAGP
jgi:ABC-type transport system involved in cytochrome bd biosynthesis fused ATPase/permease subunit